MKTFQIILIISLISFSTCDLGKCYAFINKEITRKTIETTDSFAVIIEEGIMDRIISGDVNGLYLKREDGRIVTLNCDSIVEALSAKINCSPTIALNSTATYELNHLTDAKIGDTCSLSSLSVNFIIIEGLQCVAKIESDITIKALFQTDTFPVTITCEGVITGSINGLILLSANPRVNLDCEDIPSTSSGNTNILACKPSRDLIDAYTFTLSTSTNAKVASEYVINIDENSKSIIIQGIKLSCKAKIADEIVKYSLYTSETITVTITNLGDEPISGSVTGLSLRKSGTEMDVALNCANLASTAKDASNNINCSPISNISNKGTYSLYITYGTKVAGVSPLTLDEANPKNLIIKDMFEDPEQGCEDCKAIAKITSNLTKQSLTTTDTFTITITINGGESMSGGIRGLSLLSSSGEEISITCGELPSTSPGNSNSITCSPKSDLTTAETFTLNASFSASIAYTYDLTVDENSKTLTIDPDCTNCIEESGVSNDSNDCNDSNNVTSGSFNNKFSSLLFIGTGLLL